MYATLRLAGCSRLIQPRRVVVLTAAAGVLLAAFLASVAFGSTPMPLDRVVAALLGAGEAMDRLIVNHFRLPRAVQAVEAGVCLAVAGLLLQRATRNPLASPAVLGVVDGAGLGVVLFLALFSDTNNALVVSIRWQPVAAALGGVAFLGLVFGLARDQAASPIRLILYGVAVAALAKAAMMLLIVTGPIHRASQALHWLAGSVHTATWDEATLILLAGGPLVLLAAPFARALDLLDLDDVSARSAGLRTVMTRAVAVLLAAALTATAVAFVGGIGFVGLIAPHLARLLLGRGAGSALIGAALVGSIMVVAADLAVRVLFAPLEVPTGTITAVVGAPYLIHLLTRRSQTDG